MEDLLCYETEDKFCDDAPPARAQDQQIDLLISDEIAERRNLAVKIPEAMFDVFQGVGSMKTAHQILAIPLSQFIKLHHEVRHDGELRWTSGVNNVECGAYSEL